MKAHRPSQWTEFLLEGGSVRALWIEGAALLAEIAKLHGLKDVAVRALGEALHGAIQIASASQAGEKTSLSIQSSGRFMYAFVDAYKDGHARGYLIERNSMPSDQPWGAGKLSIQQTQGQSHDDGSRPPANSVILKKSTPLDEALSEYWTQSSQSPALSVLHIEAQDSNISVSRSLLIQALPASSAEQKERIQKLTTETLRDLLSCNEEPGPVLKALFPKGAPALQSQQALSFKCDCARSRAENSLLMTGTSEIHNLLQHNADTVIRCDFCNREFVFTPQDLRILLKLGTNTQLS